MRSAILQINGMKIRVQPQFSIFGFTGKKRDAGTVTVYGFDAGGKRKTVKAFDYFELCE